MSWEILGAENIFNDTLYELRKAYNNECKCVDKKHSRAGKFCYSILSLPVPLLKHCLKQFINYAAAAWVLFTYTSSLHNFI